MCDSLTTGVSFLTHQRPSSLFPFSLVYAGTALCMVIAPKLTSKRDPPDNLSLVKDAEGRDPSYGHPSTNTPIDPHTYIHIYIYIYTQENPLLCHACICITNVIIDCYNFLALFILELFIYSWTRFHQFFSFLLISVVKFILFCLSQCCQCY